MTVRILLSMLLTSSVLASPPLPTMENDIVDVKVVRHRGDHRVRRYAGQSAMPDVIETQFPVSGDDVRLKLARVPFVPMYVVGEEVGEYIHPSQEGNLKHKGTRLLVKPAPKARRSAGDYDNPHILTSPEGGAVSFGDDAIPATEAIRQGREFHSGQANGRAAHTVETVFVVDYSDYKTWKAEYPSETMEKMREIYTYTAETMNLIYSSVKEANRALDIRIVVTQLYVLQSSSYSFTDALAVGGSIDMSNSRLMDTFAGWIPNQDIYCNADHYMLFTAVSVVETRPMESIHFRDHIAFIASHELGHSLNASHDNDVGCKDSEHHVMAAVTFKVPLNKSAYHIGNVYDFSECSVQTFALFLQSVTCTLSSETTAPAALSPFANEEIIRDRDEQCKYFTGNKNSVYHSYAPPLEKICTGMICAKRSPNGVYESPEWFLPFEGTPCGSGLVCNQGFCVQATSVTKEAVTVPPNATAPRLCQPRRRNTAATTQQTLSILAVIFHLLACYFRTV
ncbi:hypothetical protein BaRGS_00001543 [Batillaria attramentaria]|uniref:Peptidase M12B domain-containing protein n=1 Tax=Batillaria attramentaria TaxID=370345 RepID=A0ABD0M768_9CAEN